MRYDYFIIWGNGLDHVTEIVHMIDEDRNFRIIESMGLDVDDIRMFIEGLYKCDTVPMQHLRAKTKYLLNTEPKIHFILAENKQPEEKMVGTGAFQHIQCQKVTKLKIKIRNKFNPRSTTNKQILPLDAGVSHEHVIHGSDYQSQTDYVLDYLGLANLTYYRRFASDVDVRRILLDMPTYVVLRRNERYPNYRVNDDVDILCDDLNACKRHILGNTKGYDVRVSKQGIHCHVDIFMNDVLQFRFDLIDSVGTVGFTQAVLGKLIISEDGIPLPYLLHDLVLRWLEYMTHPRKTQHKDYCERFHLNYKSIADAQFSEYK